MKTDRITICYQQQQCLVQQRKRLQLLLLSLHQLNFGHLHPAANNIDGSCVLLANCWGGVKPKLVCPFYSNAF